MREKWFLSEEEILNYKKPLKYHNHKCECDCIEFDSIMERNYYLKLKEDYFNNRIIGFSVHPRFTLLAENEYFKSWTYTADFEVITLDNKKHFIDIKSIATARQPEAILKRKAMFAIHEIYVEWITFYKPAGWITIEEYKKILKAKRGIKKNGGKKS